MLILVCFSLGLSFLVLTIALWNAWSAPRLHDFSPTGDEGRRPLISVLIPARNEERNIGACLASLAKSSYPNLEILVGDDQSNDRTPEILTYYQSILGARLRLFRSSEAPPPAWTGKAWMCHMLSEQAQGDILIFCDADVRIEPAAIGQTVRALTAEKADALTAWPLQTGGSALCQGLVALISQTLLLISLPITWVPKRHPAFAAGNGQWFAWRRAAYHKVGGHTTVKASRIEDVELARQVKHHGLRLLLTVAPRSLQVQMYKDLKEASEGFRKNMFALLGGSSWGLMGLSLVASLWLWGSIASLRAYPSLLLAYILFFSLLAFAQHSLFVTPLRALICIPGSIPLALAILFRSWRGSSQGTLTWKNRALPKLESLNVDA